MSDVKTAELIRHLARGLCNRIVPASVAETDKAFQAYLEERLTGVLGAASTVCDWIGDNSVACHKAHERLRKELDRLLKGEG